MPSKSTLVAANCSGVVIATLVLSVETEAQGG